MFYSAISPYISQNSSITGFIYSRACEVAKSTGANLALKVLSLSPRGPTILLRDAVLTGSATRVKLAFAAGADPNIPDKDGETPLHIAIRRGHVDIADLLLDKGADPNIQCDYGKTPLHIASAQGHLDVVAFLLDRKAANPNIKNNLGYTPLHTAICKGHIDAALLLLQNGADPNIQNIDDETPLHRACFLRRIDAARLLLQNGADPNIQDGNGCTPLLKAIREEYFDVARLLLQNGADPNIQNIDDETALHAACGDIDATRLLLENGADPNIPDKYGYTPLHKACFYQHFDDAACLLLQNGADPNIQNKCGETSLHKACQRFINKTVIKTLIKSQHKQAVSVPALTSREIAPYPQYIRSQNFHLFLNAQNKKGQTPLHLAVKAGNNDVVEYLLENGAQILPDADGKTSLDLAFADPSILDLFKKHSGWANETAVAHAFEKRNFPALLFILKQRPLLSSELREKILADAQRPGMESIRRLLEGGY